MAFELPATPLRLRRPRAPHRRSNHEAPPRQAPPDLRHQPERRGREAPRTRQETPEELIKDLATIPEDVRKVVQNNGGGHVNHTMFWEIMKPRGGGEPTGEIADQIKDDFGSFDDFKKQFNETTAKQFGSGWGWLVLQRRQAGDRHHRQPGQSPLPGPVSHPRQRRLGARLLPEVPEQAPRLPRGLVEHRQLGGGQQALRHRQNPTDAHRQFDPLKSRFARLDDTSSLKEGVRFPDRLSRNV